MKEANSDTSDNKELTDFVLENRTPFDVSIREIMTDGPHPNFFRKANDFATFDAKNDRRIDHVDVKDKKDDAYRKGMDSAIVSTTMYLPDQYDDLIDIIMESGLCYSKRMASMYISSCGLLPTIEDMLSPDCKSMPVIRKLVQYYQRWLRFQKENFCQNNLNSLSAVNTQADVDRPGEIVEKKHVSRFEMVATIIDQLAYMNNVPKTEVYRLMINNAVIGSKTVTEDGDVFDIFDEGHVRIAEIDRQYFLDAIKKSSAIYKNEALILFKTHLRLNYLGEEQIKHIKKELMKLDKIFDSVPCKYCLGHNVKVNRHLNGKKQYRCKDCNRLFTVHF